MRVILLLLAPDRYSGRAIECAIEAAERTESELQAVYIVDPAMAEQVHRVVGERGFVGEAQCEQLCSTIQDEYMERGREVLEEVAQAARKRGRTTEGAVLAGPFIDTALRHIRETHAAEAVVPRRPGSRLRRMFRGSDVEALQSIAPCPITIIER